MTSFTQLTLTSSDPPEPFTDRLRLAVAAYLARFKGSSREHTESDLRCYLAWCAEQGLDTLAARRPHLELYIRWIGGPPLPWTVTTLGSLGTGGIPMVTKYQKFGDGYKAEAVKLYRESNQTIAETARNLGLKESTLANWVKKDKENEAVAVGEAPLTPAERTRIRELEADVRRLNMENAFLKKASAYFASQNL